MLSWRLWSSLLNPPSSRPLFQRIARLDYHFQWPLPGWHLPSRWLVPLAAPLLIVALFTYPQIALLALLLMPMSIAFMVIAVPFILLGAATALGMFWSVVVCRRLIHERETLRYDLLCMAPEGEVGVLWSIGSASLHRGALFELFDTAVRALIFVMSVLLGLLALVAVGIAVGSAGSSSPRDVIVSLRTLIEAVAIVAAFFVHYQQSAVLSVLLGAVMAFHVRSRLEAQFIVPMLYLALQLATYAAAWLLAVQGLTGLYARFFAPDSLMNLTLPVAMLLMFYALREAAVIGCWLMLKQRLQANIAEYDIILRLAR